MSGLQKCDTCGTTAVAYDHGTERYVCVEHDRGFTEPLRYKGAKEILAHRDELIAAVRAHLKTLPQCVTCGALAPSALAVTGEPACMEHAWSPYEPEPWADTAALLAHLTAEDVR